MKRIFSIYFLLILSFQVFAQLTPQPTPPAGAFSTGVNFNFGQNSFDFNYQGVDGNLSYRYAPGTDGSPAAIKCVVNSYTFSPSLGGLAMYVGGQERFPWTPGVTFALLNASASADTLTTNWKMSYSTYTLHYTYKFFLSGRTLVMDIESQEATVSQVMIGRCENAVNPKIIPVPYLPSMNVLYTDNGTEKLFMSEFFDWERSDASLLAPADQVFSPTSVFFAQDERYFPVAGGNTNPAKERQYITVSPSIEDVLPNLPNPVSALKSVSADHLIYDAWSYSFSNVLSDVNILNNSGIKNIWLIVHDWQNGGYDNMYPDVMPANPARGGSSGLLAIQNACVSDNYLFALHENYTDIWPNAPSYNVNEVSKNANGSLQLGWFNPTTSIQAYHMKPTRAAHFLNIFSPQIHQTYFTTAAYLDVHSAINPSYVVDYDPAVSNPAKYREAMQLYRQLPGLSRAQHAGPVSGEGAFHFLYAGYFDDIEGQINTAKQNGYWQGCRLPLLIDFQLNKIHPLMCTHGVGYYERFFSLNDGTQHYFLGGLDSALMYIATELAYGNAGFIPHGSDMPNFLAVAKLEHKHVLPAQKLYANANAVSILYDDNGTMVTASQYIKNHPATFDDINSLDFMSKVQVTYNNGTVVYVNRHPTQNWQITPGISGSSFNYHATINSIDSLGVDSAAIVSTWTLPKKNGWLVIAPQTVTSVDDHQNIYPCVTVYPNPSSGIFAIQSSVPVYSYEIVNLLGEQMYAAPVLNGSNSIATSIPFELPAGIYFIRMKTNSEGIITQKISITHN